MDAKQFYNDYASLITNQYWDEYHDNSRWTDRVTALIESILQKNGLTAQREYFRIDVTGWVSHWTEVSDEASDLGLRPHLWDLKAAVEHENNSADWTDELVKLAHIRCPLKVVIGYTPCDIRGEGELEEKRLAFAARLLQRVEAFDSAFREQYLLILGNSGPKSSTNPSYTEYGYRGYLYNDSARAFLPL